jgi:type IV secretory pathway VirB10-like protein
MPGERTDIDIGESLHGGGRFNVLLIILGAMVAMVVGMVVVHSLFARSTVAPIASESAEEDDLARDKARIEELASYAKPSASTMPSFHFPPVMIPAQTAAQPTPEAERQLSAFQQWAQEEYLRAHMAPPLVKNFHDHSALEVAQAGANGVTSAATPPASTSVHPPTSPFMVMAGSVIPATLVNGINSDLPGPVIAQVSQNIFDSATGKSLLIPQGSKLLGDYSNAALYGQQRVRIEFQRIIFPDTSSMDLPHALGADNGGYAGFNDEVNNHYLATFGTAAVMALISAGQTVGQIAAFNNSNSGYGPYGDSNQWELATQSAGSGAASQLGNVGAQTISKGLNRAPTLTVRPGFQLNVMLMSDLVFPGPFKGVNG